MATPKRILLIDDDPALRESLAEQLAPEFETVQADSGARALAALTGGHFDAILLDVGLPDADGRDICRQLRANGVLTPVIMLTAAAGEGDVIGGLDAGANDYVTKPFRFGVLLARLRAQLRSHESSTAAIFSIGPFSFQPGAKLLVETASRKKIRLTEKEAAILRYLLRADGRPVARETLLGEVWGYNTGVNTHTLETHVYRLRQKIERDPAHAQILVTSDGGYRLSAAK